MTRLIATRKRAGLMGAGHASLLEGVTAYVKTLLVGTDAAAVRSTLGLVIGTDVQARDPDLDAIAALSPPNDNFMQRKAGGWTDRTPAQVRTDLAMGLELIGSPLTVSSPVASIAFISIPSSGYSKFILACWDLATNEADTYDEILLHVSTDNGSTWKTASDDYLRIQDVTDCASLAHAVDVYDGPLIAGASTPFKHGYLELHLPGLGNPSRNTSCFKTANWSWGSASAAQPTAATHCAARKGVLEADNAMRLIPKTGTQFTAGKVILMGVRE